MLAHLGLVLIGAGLAGGCARPPPAAPSPPGAGATVLSAAGQVRAARFIALPDAVSARWVGNDARGSRLFIKGGQRVVLHRDGRMEAGLELLPDLGALSLELPAHLGGGYLFYVRAAGSTSLWRAPSWTGKLTPFAQLEFEAEDIVAGFDRLYLIDKRSGDLLALDPETGKGSDLGALPAAAAYVSLVFVGPWFGAVEVPFQGVLASFDAGASWRTVDAGATGLRLEGQTIVMSRPTDQLVLDASGGLKQREAPPRPATPEDDDEDAPVTTGAAPNADAAPIRVGPLGAWPLRAAALYGWPLSSDVALVLYQGTLAKLSLADGRVLASSQNAVPTSSECTPLALGKGVGFVCHREDAGTSLYRFDAPLGLTPLLQFSAPRFVAGNGRGDLTVRGSCSDVEPPAGAARSGATYCLVFGSGERRELNVRGDLGAERVVALHDGRSAVLVPPRLGAPGRLTVVGKDGAATTQELRLPRDDASVRALFGRGLWLDGVTETADGRLAAWVAGGGAFVGVRVQLDGTVEAGRPGKHVTSAFLNGPRAVELTPNGLGRQSLDGGFTWAEFELPPGLAAGKPSETGAMDLALQGCSRVGCAVGGWLRLGWWDKPERQVLPVAARPEPPRFESRGARWSFQCAPTGQAAGGSDVDRGDAAGEAPSGRFFGASLPQQQPRWPAFLGVAPPRRHEGLALTQATASVVAPVRGYAWGPASTGWPALGRWLLRASDRFAIDDGRVWSTLESRAPWPDAVIAAQTFGQGDGGSGYTQWSAMLDPAQPGGVLLVKARGTTELYVFEQGRAIAPVGNVAGAGIVELAGAVEIDDTWYVGSGGPQQFRVFRVEQGQLVSVAELPARRRGASGEAFLARLVRSTAGDRLGLWVQVGRLRGASTAWYVLPLDPRSGAVGDPLELDASALATAPEPCAVDAEGWLLEGRLPIEPYLQLDRGFADVRPSAVEARVVADASGSLCLEGLAATADAPLARVPRVSAEALAEWSQGKPTVPLTLRTGQLGARRVGLRCVR